jgi:hypothetical protein
MNIGHIIVNEPLEEGKKHEYLAVDNTSGGHYYWTAFLRCAEIFSSYDKAVTVVTTSSDFVRDYSNTFTTRIPRMLHSAAGLCYDKSSGQARITIRPVIVGEADFDKTYALDLNANVASAVLLGVAFVKEEHWFVEISEGPLAGNIYILLGTYEKLYVSRNETYSVHCTVDISKNEATLLSVL